jgi:hypothetical protein
MKQRLVHNGSAGSAAHRLLALVGLCLLLAACSDPPPPRTFTYFMEDRIAREGTIIHCDEHPQDTQNDIECANARRAAVAIALRRERERVETLERESRIKLEALRNEMAERERAVREATLAAARAERERYESMWRGTPESADGEIESAGPPADRLSRIELPLRLRQDTAQ